MTTRRQQAQLISPDDVDRVFDDATIRCLARLAKLPASCDLEAFGRSVLAGVRQYLIDAMAPQPGEQRKEINALARQVWRARAGNPDALGAVVEALERLHPKTREFLDYSVGPYRNLPAREELLHPVHGRKALSLLLGLLHTGAHWKDGRKRPGGKRSRPTLHPDPRVPRARRGRPPDTNEFFLCNYLAIAYFKAARRFPPRQVAPYPPGRDTGLQALPERLHLSGPFARLLREVLDLLGAENVSSVELINKHGAALKREAFGRERRRLVAAIKKYAAATHK